MGMLVIVKDWGVFRKKINRMEPSTGNILEENLVQSAFHQTLEDEFTFQQDNNLKHQEVSEWPCYSFDLNLYGKT